MREKPIFDAHNCFDRLFRNFVTPGVPPMFFTKNTRRRKKALLDCTDYYEGFILRAKKKLCDVKKAVVRRDGASGATAGV